MFELILVFDFVIYLYLLYRNINIEKKGLNDMDFLILKVVTIGMAGFGIAGYLRMADPDSLVISAVILPYLIALVPSIKRIFHLERLSFEYVDKKQLCFDLMMIIIMGIMVF